MTARTLLLIPALSLLVAACGDKNTPDPASRDSAIARQAQLEQASMKNDRAPGTVTPDTAALARMDATFPKDAADPSTRTDTADGTLTVKGSGAKEGTWKMFDATAVLSEDVRAGSTVVTLSIEGHRTAPVATLVLRLTSNKAIAPGRYGIEQAASPVRVDARWDLNGAMYRAINGTTATGWVEIAALSADHVRGSYNLTLPPVTPGGPAQTVSGEFDQDVVK